MWGYLEPHTKLDDYIPLIMIVVMVITAIVWWIVG